MISSIKDYHTSMMRKLLMAGIAMMTIAISSCDEDTTTLGDSLTNTVDKFVSISETYRVESQSLMTDSVLATSIYRYLGKIKDPETSTYITCNYTTQFNLLENERTALFPTKDVIGKDDSGKPVADSCVIRVMITGFQGDSLAAMKMKLCELAKPIPNSTKYYTDFDVEEEGYLRTGNKAIQQYKVYSVSDLTQSDSLRNVLRGAGYYQYITIPLNSPYTDVNDVTYSGYDAAKKAGTGYGTYILRQYYDHPEYFANANTFAHKICPGFYLKSVDGEGCMLEVVNTQLIVFFHYTKDGKTVNSSRAFISSPEVLQITQVTNDKQSMKELEKVDTCTYLKTPSGIFTEVTLPIDSIKWLTKKDQSGKVISTSHENDTIMAAKITFQHLKQNSKLADKLLEEPTDLLMVQRDKLYSFFEENNVPDNITSFLATYDSTLKTYSFNSLSSLINTIYTQMKPQITNADGTINLDKVEAYKKAHPNWNKVVLIPVLVTTTTSSGVSTVSSVSNSMNISSVRLIGGKNNKHVPLTMSIIYNRNE